VCVLCVVCVVFMCGLRDFWCGAVWGAVVCLICGVCLCGVCMW
jgi:hypothetical protein